jgi:mono/diheme cytochrome c family protein
VTTAAAIRLSGVLLGLGLAMARGAPRIAADAPVQGTAPVGQIERGAALYAKTYRCYACHGYSGQTGLPRLVPMARTQEAFIAYLRKPSTPMMPAYANVPAQDLADIHAYLRSLKDDSRPVESIPPLDNLLKERAKRK